VKIGDLVIYGGKQIGIITYIWAPIFDNGMRVCILFNDGECEVNSCDCEVISESR